MSTQIQSSRSPTEQKAIALLGSGLNASVVATALGVSESRISQLMADKSFADEVSQLRFQNLQKHNEMDNAYDRMEQKIAKNLEEMLPLMTRPMELLKAAQVVNGMKRRGASSPDQMVQTTQVVQLLMPTVITQKFTTNVNNQVINAGNQTLETIQGSSLLAAAKAKSQQALSAQPISYTEAKEITNHEQPTNRASSQTIQERVAAITNSTTSESGQTQSTGTATIYK